MSDRLDPSTRGRTGGEQTRVSWSKVGSKISPWPQVVPFWLKLFGLSEKSADDMRL